MNLPQGNDQRKIDWHTLRNKLTPLDIKTLQALELYSRNDELAKHLGINERALVARIGRIFKRLGMHSKLEIYKWWMNK